jgi:hypothetical protein
MGSTITARTMPAVRTEKPVKLPDANGKNGRRLRRKRFRIMNTALIIGLTLVIFGSGMIFERWLLFNGRYKDWKVIPKKEV